jgi:hypothetical protein
MYIKYVIIPFYILITAVFLSSGCNSTTYRKENITDTLPEPVYNPYFPVDEGNKWEYINEAPREETELFKVDITYLKYDGNDQIVELSSFPFFSRNEEKSTLRIKPNGEVYYVNKQLLTDQLFVPETSNFERGYQWQFGQWSGLIGGTKETIKAENETFTDCIFLNFSISFTFSAEVWVAKDKGIVKWGYNRTNPPTPKSQYYVLNKLSLAK